MELLGLALQCIGNVSLRTVLEKSREAGSGVVLELPWAVEFSAGEESWGNVRCRKGPV